jgi:type IV pilus assembly protein PilV
MICRSSFPNRQRGASMIEVMVSMLVLGAGVLGIAGAQATALRNSQSSYERSQAALMAAAMFDAMRANVAVARAGGYNFNPTLTACAIPATGATLADADRNTWVTNLKAGLGTDTCGRVACASGTCTVTIQWNDGRGSGGGTAQQLVTVGRL